MVLQVHTTKYEVNSRDQSEWGWGSSEADCGMYCGMWQPISMDISTPIVLRGELGFGSFAIIGVIACLAFSFRMSGRSDAASKCPDEADGRRSDRRMSSLGSHLETQMQRNCMGRTRWVM